MALWNQRYFSRIIPSQNDAEKEFSNTLYDFGRAGLRDAFFFGFRLLIALLPSRLSTSRLS
jgi:hypothetical protein